MSYKSKQKRLRNLYKKDIHCHWCNCETILPENCNNKKHKKVPDNMATLDHLNDRYNLDKRRMPNYTQEERTVLSCKKCNIERSDKNASIAIKREKSNAHPIAFYPFENLIRFTIR